MGSESGEIFSFSLKNMRLLGSYLHSASHHYQTNTMMAGAESPSSSSHESSHVTLLRTTPNDTFFLWSYVYPGSTVYLWNHASKKIMSAFNLKKAFTDLNFTPNRKSATQMVTLDQSLKKVTLTLYLIFSLSLSSWM